MKILFIHPNMPGQYKHLAHIAGSNPDNQVVFITKPREHIQIPGVHKIEYKVSRQVMPDTHRYLINFERAIFQGQEVWRICKKLKDSGFIPDVICAHPGWGDGLFIKDIFHNAPMLSFLEFYYSGYASDVGFLKDEKQSYDDAPRVRIKNACNLYNLEICDWGISPTYWQWVQNPAIFRPKISVLHDGIDTSYVAPNPATTQFTHKDKTFTKDMEIITYISRNFEPYRGFDTVMKAAVEILKRRPKAHIIMVGADGVSYGKTPQGYKTWRQKYLQELQPDLSRLHFLGYLDYDQMLNVLRISSAHIYLTVPFVLSWSMMESMAMGCMMICSSTQPVKEVMEHGKNGYLVDFFSPEQVADAVDFAFREKEQVQEMRRAARQTIVDKYDLNTILPLHMNLIYDVAAKKFPPPTDAKMKMMNPMPSIAREWL